MVGLYWGRNMRTYFLVTIFRPCTNRVDVVTDLIVDDVTAAPARLDGESSCLSAK